MQTVIRWAGIAFAIAIGIVILFNLAAWTFSIGTYAKTTDTSANHQQDGGRFKLISPLGGADRGRGGQQGRYVQRDTPHARNFAAACGKRPFAQLTHGRTSSDCYAPEGWSERIGGGPRIHHGYGRYPD